MLQNASFIGFLRTILIFILVFTIFKYVMRLLAPYIVRSVAKKAEAHFRNQSASQKPTQKEGEISIDKIPNSKPSKHDVGEYVDYEDVE
jgi:hypothetical protein